jgi:hypothetical protein
MWANHIVDFNHLKSFSARLQRLAACSVRLIGFQRFEKAEVKEFAVLLDHLRVAVDVVDSKEG